MTTRFLVLTMLIAMLSPALSTQAQGPLMTARDDHFIAFLPNPNAFTPALHPLVGTRPMAEWGPSRVTVLSPGLHGVTLSFNPPATFKHHVVATYHFDGRLTARAMDGSYHLTPTEVQEWLYPITVDWNAPDSRNLLGTRAEGTWTIIQPWTFASPIGGIQLNVRGKTFDDVMPRSPQARSGLPALAGVDVEWLPTFLVQQASALGISNPAGSEPIESTGYGSWAADQGTRVKTWNFHEQRGARYDVGLVTSANLANPEQNPALQNFLVGPEAYQEAPTQYASGGDAFWAHLPPGGQAKVWAPDGSTMVVEFQPASDLRLCNVGSSTGGDPIAATGQSFNDCIAAAVVHVGLGGNVISARQAHNPTRPVPLGQIRVTGQLLGVPADGTWTIQSAISLGGLPAGTRLSVAGRVFDDVHGPAEPIEGSGNAQPAGGLDPVRTWNWHMQTVARYDTGPSSSSQPEEWVSHHRHLGIEVSRFITVPTLLHENPVPDDLVRRVRPSYNNGILELWLDRNADGVRDKGEAATLDLNDVMRDPTGLVDGSALDSFRPRLQPQAPVAAVNSDSRTFRVVAFAFAPPNRVTVVTDGAYDSVTDAALYPLGAGDEKHHLMLTGDPTPVDGTMYEVTLQMRAGCHAYHFEASGPVGWTRTVDQTVCV